MKNQNQNQNQNQKRKLETKDLEQVQGGGVVIGTIDSIGVEAVRKAATLSDK